MTEKGSFEDGSGPEEVRVTIVVEPGRVRAVLTKLRARARVGAGLAVVGVIAAVVAGTIIVASSSTGRERRSPGTYSPPPTDSNAVLTRFGVRLNCPRFTLVSPDGTYARVDFEPTAPCGSYGNHVTLILHRIHGVWVRQFEATGWRCPMSRLPRPVATELGLCGRTALQPRWKARSPAQIYESLWTGLKGH